MTFGADCLPPIQSMVHEKKAVFDQLTNYISCTGHTWVDTLQYSGQISSSPQTSALQRTPQTNEQKKTRKRKKHQHLLWSSPPHPPPGEAVLGEVEQIRLLRRGGIAPAQAVRHHLRAASRRAASGLPIRQFLIRRAFGV